jgi:hypothetical protein
VSTYRIYFLRQDGHFTGVTHVDYASDAEAVKKAADMLNGHCGVEVWETARLVGSLTAKREQTEAFWQAGV